MKLDPVVYSTFLNFLKATNHLYQDINIQNSMFCQKADNAAIVVKADLTDIFPESVNLQIVMIKTYIDNLDLFSSSMNLDFSVEDNWIMIEDEFTKLNIRQADLSLINNAFINENTLKEKIRIDREKDLLIKLELSSMILTRILKLSTSYQSTNLIFDINNDVMNIKLTSADKNSKAVILKNIKLDKNYEIHYQLMYPIDVFHTKFDNTADLNIYYNHENAQTMIELVTNIKNISTTFMVKGAVIK